VKPYPPAWLIVPQAFVRKERWPGGYKVTGMPLVSPGQDVVPDQPILRWQGVRKTSDGRSNSMARSGDNTAQDVVPAGLRGRVVEITGRGGVVIESHAMLVQGVIGAGDQVAGIITLWRSDSSNNRQSIPPGAILVVPGTLSFLLLRQAVASGVVGIVASSVALKDLEGFLHVDFIAFLQEERIEQRILLQQHFPLPTLLFTDGLLGRRGSSLSLPKSSPSGMPTHLLNILSRYQGSIALLSGETSLRHGIVPELIISQPPGGNQFTLPAAQPNTLLIPGALVRVYGGEQHGITGIIDYLFVYAQKFPSGLHARAARLRLEDGSFLIVPLSSLERIG
jgi:hypothetical protein